MGFGGALIIENEVFRGAMGNAGEFSGILAPGNCSRCDPRCWVLRASLVERGHRFENIDEMLVDFDANWPGVDEWIAAIKHPINRVITAISAVFESDRIVVGGGRMPQTLAELIGELGFYDGSKRRGRHQPRPVLVVSRVKGIDS